MVFQPMPIRKKPLMCCQSIIFTKRTFYYYYWIDIVRLLLTIDFANSSIDTCVTLKRIPSLETCENKFPIKLYWQVYIRKRKFSKKRCQENTESETFLLYGNDRTWVINLLDILKLANNFNVSLGCWIEAANRDFMFSY